MATYAISAKDTDMGEYIADSAAAALDAYARDAGYTDYADVVAQFGDDATVVEIDTDALCLAVEKEFGHAVFQDSYGGGIALVDGVSFATYAELADSIGKTVADFRA